METFLAAHAQIDAVLSANDGMAIGALEALFKIGCTATRAALRHLKGEPLPEKIMLPAEVIDKTNYRAWLVPVDQRACPDWAEMVAGA
jgi:ribose transport system substrate-binding protein